MSGENENRKPNAERRLAPVSLVGIYGGYDIALSNRRGGKAGAGHNKTATIQVREPVRPGEYLLKAQFRYTMASSASKANAHAKARAWIDCQRLTTKMPDAGRVGPLTVAETQSRRVCRICKLNNNPAPGNPLVLNYGEEYAHEQCLKRPNDQAEL